MTLLDPRPQTEPPPLDVPRWHATPGLVYHEPAEHGRPWVVEAPGGRYARLGTDAVALLRAADGLRASELTDRLGPRWDEAATTSTLAALEKLGLARQGEPQAAGTAPGRPRRLRFAAPASVQLALVDPAAWMDRHRRLVSRLASDATAAGLLGAGALGLLVLAAQASALARALATPLPLVGLAAVFAGFLAVSSLHELGHAATLHCGGGRVRRLGVMVLYLSPVLFCDTTDGWRLPDRRSRVRVSLAGVVVNFGLGGAVSVGAALAAGELRTCLLVLAALCYAGSVLNLLPVVKFDGYLALMAALDIPFLRVKAVEDWRSWLAWALFGAARPEPELPGRGWGPAFGLASAVAPGLLVALAGWNLFEALGNWGRAGAALGLAAVGAAAWLVGRSAWRLARRARSRGVRPWRLAAGSALLAAAGAGLLTISVPDTIHAGYVIAGARTQLVAEPAEAARLLRPGAAVELQEQGLALERQVGRAELTGPARRTRVPLAAVTPFLTTGERSTGYTFALSSVRWTGAHRATGAASVHLGSLSAGRWIYERLVRSPLDTLFG